MRILALALALPSCGGVAAEAREAPWNTAPAGMKDASSGTSAERFFPLVDGHVYLYTTTNDAGEQGVLVARAHRTSQRRGELRLPSGARRFEYTDEGVLRVDTGTFVLKQPISLGTSWTGEHGGPCRVLSVDVAIEVPAGRFSGCVQTLEERLGDRPVRYVSTLCPDVGMVMIEASSGASYEKAELTSYAAALEMGPDGLSRLPPAP